VGRSKSPCRGPPDAQQGEITATPGFYVFTRRNAEIIPLISNYYVTPAKIELES